MLAIISLVFGTSKLCGIGSDLGFVVKGFKQGVKEAESIAELEPHLTSHGATVEVAAKESERSTEDFR